jgi:hypothetical protein
MNVFISAVVSGLEPFRDAAKVVGQDVKRSEDFAASPPLRSKPG